MYIFHIKELYNSVKNRFAKLGNGPLRDCFISSDRAEGSTLLAFLLVCMCLLMCAHSFFMFACNFVLAHPLPSPSLLPSLSLVKTGHNGYCILCFS